MCTRWSHGNVTTPDPHQDRPTAEDSLRLSFFVQEHDVAVSPSSQASFREGMPTTVSRPRAESHGPPRLLPRRRPLCWRLGNVPGRSCTKTSKQRDSGGAPRDPAHRLLAERYPLSWKREFGHTSVLRCSYRAVLIPSKRSTRVQRKSRGRNRFST